MNLQEGLVSLFLLCERAELSCELRYDNGKFIFGELINFDNPTAEPDPSTIRQGPKGYNVEVGGTVIRGENGSEQLHPTLKSAVIAGLKLYKVVNGQKHGH
jgi:hypothetical protein